MKNINNFRALGRVYRIIEEFRKLDPEIPSQAINAFLYIVLHEGCSVKDIGEALNLRQSSASRNVALLSKMHRLGKPGLGLIEAKEDPRDRRWKTVNLTARGRRFLEDLDIHIGE